MDCTVFRFIFLDYKFFDYINTPFIEEKSETLSQILYNTFM
jgi:hypothetical protein